MNLVETVVLVAAVLVGAAGIGLILLAVVGVGRPVATDAERRRPRDR